CDGCSSSGCGPVAAGTTTPASGSSVRGVVSVSTAPTSPAAASRAVSAGKFQRVSIVFRTDVWSSGMASAATRNTVPAAISGDTSTVETRGPKRLKSNPYSPAVLSGGTALVGGGT